MMRAPWMALLCAVFVSLCPLPVDAGCPECEIKFKPSVVEPILECAQIDFRLREHCGCEIEVTVSNKCSKDLIVHTYGDDNDGLVECFEEYYFSSCKLLRSGETISFLRAVPSSSHESKYHKSVIYLESMDNLHWLTYETYATSITSFSLGCGGMTAPHENSSNFEGFLILTVIFIVASVRRKISG